MPLGPNEIPAAAARYLQTLAADADARDRLAACGEDAEAVASEVGGTLDMPIDAGDVHAMAAHINEHLGDTAAEIAAMHPSLTAVIQ